MELEPRKYIYEGPVVAFGKCIDQHWTGETIATSAGKARSNLTYQYKKQNKMVASARISLPGEIKKNRLKGRIGKWKTMLQIHTEQSRNRRLL